jgi:tyrosine-protein phosphatase SIW14
MESTSGAVLAPPISFAMVSEGLYRSGFPTRHNLTYLSRLGLRSVVKLEKAAYPPETSEWLERHGIRVTECAVVTNKEPFVLGDPAEICKALRVLIDPSQHPVLIHSLKGQERMGVVIGCLRRLQRWSIAAIFEEYRRFAGAAVSLLDLQCIELFDISAVGSPAQYQQEGGTQGRGET